MTDLWCSYSDEMEKDERPEAPSLFRATPRPFEEESHDHVFSSKSRDECCLTSILEGRRSLMVASTEVQLLRDTSSLALLLLP
jgi:hypothetical protein